MPSSDLAFNTKIYKTQGASREVIASGGAIIVEAGGQIDASAGSIVMPGNLGRGYIPLVAIGTKTTATASGVAALSTTGVWPARISPDVTSGIVAYNWATAQVAPLFFENVRIPDDLSTAGPLRVHYTAECGSGATDDINVNVRAQLTTANLGATGALSSTPIERTVSIASGSVPSSGLLGVTIFPGTHATGFVRLYSAGISYQRKTS